MTHNYHDLHIREISVVSFNCLLHEAGKWSNRRKNNEQSALEIKEQKITSVKWLSGKFQVLKFQQGAANRICMQCERVN